MEEEKKKNILSHIDKIEQYAHMPGNEWLLHELQQRFFVAGRVDDIYEYCIENIIHEQALGFYQAFPLKAILPQLVQDFVRMEHIRRKNNFEDFAMAVYQQIECITNTICRTERFEFVTKQLIGHPAYVGSKQGADGKWIPPTLASRTGTFQIARLLFGDSAQEKVKSSAQALYAIDKVRLVLYFICYGAKLQSSSYDLFLSQKTTADDIYQFRNKNHRGSVATDWQQAIYDRIDGQKGLYYVKFLQFLYFFVEKTSSGLTGLDELYSYAKSQTPIEVIVPPKVVGYVDLNKIPKK